MSTEELNRRLEEAAQVVCMLHRAAQELKEAGQNLKKQTDSAHVDHDPIHLLLQVHQALQVENLAFATYGGLAMALHGVPRFTQDADITLSAETLNYAVKALQAHFELSLIDLEKQPFGGLELTRVTVFDEGSGGNTVDLITPHDQSYAKRMMTRALVGSLRQQPIHVVAAEDFIILKILSTRDQDLSDAASVLEKSAALLDIALIDQEIELLAVSSPHHPVQARWQKIKPI